jgi:hypothetical protein
MSNTKPAPIRNPYQKLLESMFEAPDRNSIWVHGYGPLYPQLALPGL